MTQLMIKTILISCSNSKHNVPGAKAEDLYNGILFNAGMDYALKYKLKVLILSAKYGIIEPSTFIETYDLKMKEAYSGPWPEEPCYYLGGKTYFTNAPSHLLPLVPSASIGIMVYYTRLLENGVSREAVIAMHEKGKPKGIIQSIYYLLKKDKFTKEALYQELIKDHGETPSMRKTIQAQVSNSRLGKEKKCVVHREGDKFWITSDVDFYAK